jgi:hypothetical protein
MGERELYLYSDRVFAVEKWRLGLGAPVVLDVNSSWELEMTLLVDLDVFFSTTVFAETREEESTRAMRRECMNERARGQGIGGHTSCFKKETERKLTGDGQGRQEPHVSLTGKR